MNKEIFSAAELSSVFEQKIDFGICDIKISSKEVREGDLFVAIRGSVFDGHDFCEEALKNGASLLLVEKKIANLPENRQILVDSYMTAMEKLAKFKDADLVMLASSLSEKQRRRKCCNSCCRVKALSLTAFTLHKKILIVRSECRFVLQKCLKIQAYLFLKWE